MNEYFKEEKKAEDHFVFNSFSSGLNTPTEEENKINNHILDEYIKHIKTFTQIEIKKENGSKNMYKLQKNKTINKK